MAAIGKLQSLPFSNIHGEKCWPSVDKISPCEKACPLGTDIPSYIMAIAQGKFDEALAVIRDTNPFPSICGRVCHQPCESECNRSLIDEPIAIKGLKRAAFDYAKDKYLKPERARQSKQDKIAIIGSGPAGLTAAYNLVRKGYAVTVYETSSKAGGWLTHGIPDFILPHKIADGEIQYIADCGVEIKTGVKIGKDLTLDDLRARGFKAILLATGSQISTSLNIPGSDLKNVIFALDVLKKAKMKAELSFHGTILVIGGGAVAIDAARTTLRLGAHEAHVACLESRVDMPAWIWEIEAAEQEGVKIHTSLAPQSFEKVNESDKENIKINFRRVASTSTDPDGRISWKLIEGAGSSYSMEADSIIIAIGQASDTSCAQENGLKFNARGAFEVDQDTLQTSAPGIFAAGDAINMRGTVTESIAMGHKAAKSIERYLMGNSPENMRKTEAKEALTIDPKSTSPWLVKKARWDIPKLIPADAVRMFSEVHLGFTEEEAIEEAKRCLNCRMCANCIYGRGQICYETALRLLK